MVSTAGKILSSLLISLSLLAFASPALAKRTRIPVVRKWVVKLKQNSLFNRRPFQFAAPAASADGLFVGVDRGFFYGIDARRGKKKWKFSAQAPVHAQAEVSPEAVYFADMEGTVYALNLQTGQPLWRTSLGSPVASKPLRHGDRLYLVTLTKQIFCLDANQGKELWSDHYGSGETGFTLHGSADPVWFDGLILIGFSDGMMIAVAAADGQVRWTKQLGDRFAELHDVDATPWIAEGGERAYAATADGQLFALNPHSGEVIWEMAAGGVGNPVVSDDRLYVTAGSILYCFQAQTGQILWEQNLAVPGLSSPAVYDRWVVAAATKGKTYFIDRLSGDIVHSWYVRGGSYSDPVVAGNRVYILSNAGRLYAFQFRE